MFGRSGGLGGAPAAAALRARPGAGHRRPPNLALVLGADADRAELDLPVFHAAADSIRALGIRERDVPVQPRAGLLPVNREVTRDGAAVVAHPLAGEPRRGRGGGARRGERCATADESETGSEGSSCVPGVSHECTVPILIAASCQLKAMVPAVLKSSHWSEIVSGVVSVMTACTGMVTQSELVTRVSWYTVVEESTRSQT